MNDLLDKECHARIETLQQSIIKAGADACIITSSVNIYYLFGQVFDGHLYILPDGEAIKFVRRPSDIEGEDVIYIHKPELIPEYLEKRGIALPKRLMIESDVLSLSVASRLGVALGSPGNHQCVCRNEANKKR